MREIRRNRVAFDICTSCRGVWLEPGELESLVNNAIAEHSAKQAKLADDARNQRQQRNGDDDDESVLDLVFDLLK